MFHLVSEEEIKKGKITDVYFQRTVKVIKTKGLDKKVVAEIRTQALPENYPWAILGGVEEAVRLLEGLPVNVWSMPEGTLFHPLEPVMVIEGNYIDFCPYETPLLGFLCQASGIATRAARCKIAAGGKPVYHFGARRMHPGITLMIDRASFIGGCDGVAVDKSAEFLKEEPVGTIPHSLILLTGDTVKAIEYFDEVISPEVKRVALIDTLGDEKFEALRVAEKLGEKLFAVRLDTPSSRRGDFLKLLQEVRWELDLHGFKKVKLFVSGGMKEENILRLKEIADAFGVGTWISGAPVVDFSLDIVEIEGKPKAKRGKEAGRKKVLRCLSCGKTRILPSRERRGKCECGGEVEELLKPFLREGEILESFPSPRLIREKVLLQLKKVTLEEG